MNTKKILMYSTTWCPDCHRAEAFFKHYGVGFEKVDIEQSEGAAEIVMNLANGKRSVPTLVITDEAGGEQVLVNPRLPELAGALGITLN
ncbi:MAG: glutaredoxin family protein [Rhizobacter sp.]|nr:glutaredoxin family protein [Chlorobiales bacterium]